MEYYSAMKKKGNPAIWDSMDEPEGYCTKWNKDKYSMGLIYMWN